MEPRPEKRPAGLGEIHRFLEDRWMSKGGMEKTNETAIEDEGLCPSMYSFHSSPEEKNKLLFTLTQYGIETTVDRCAKKDRIRQWIQTSVIEEENEEEEAEESIRMRDHQTGPPGERTERGPVAENKINGNSRVTNKERRLSMISLKNQDNGTYVPPIDPRIPLEEQRNKLMTGYVNNNKEKPTQNGHPIQNGSITNNNITHHQNGKSSPFQNVVVINNGNGNKESQESDNSSDSSTTIRHKINIQMPQSEMYNCSISPKLVPKEKKQVTLNLNSQIMNGASASPVNHRRTQQLKSSLSSRSNYNTNNYRT